MSQDRWAGMRPGIQWARWKPEARGVSMQPLGASSANSWATETDLKLRKELWSLQGGRPRIK